MPSASQMFFQMAGLTRWGREPDFVAPKPLSARAIKKLGDALDRAEQLGGSAYRAAWIEYGEAITARKLYHECKLENSKRAPKSRDRHALLDALVSAEERIDLIEEMRPEFATAREFIDANAAFMLAEKRYEVAKIKFEDADRSRRSREAADRAANIVRTNYRRKPVEVHL